MKRGVPAAVGIRQHLPLLNAWSPLLKLCFLPSTTDLLPSPTVPGVRSTHLCVRTPPATFPSTSLSPPSPSVTTHGRTKETPHFCCAYRRKKGQPRHRYTLDTDYDTGTQCHQNAHEFSNCQSWFLTIPFLHGVAGKCLLWLSPYNLRMMSKSTSGMYLNM